MMKHIHEHCIYELKTGAPEEIGANAQVDIREIRLWDLTVKEDAKDRFLGDMKKHAWANFLEEEPPHGGDSLLNTNQNIRHGVDGKGFKYGVFRRMVQWVLKQFNARAIDMKKIPGRDNPALDAARTKEPWHSNFMILGELPDGFESTGRENS